MGVMAYFLLKGNAGFTSSTVWRFGGFCLLCFCCLGFAGGGGSGLAKFRNPRLEIRAKCRDEAWDFNVSAWCWCHDPNIDSNM